MKYYNFTEKIDNKRIYNLWNNSYQSIYPIDEALFNRNVSNIYEHSSFYVLNDNDQLVGFVLAKIWNDEFKINGYDDSAWISLIYVDPQYRNQGIGTKLLDLVEKEMRQLGKKVLYLGKDYLNYFPGLPIDLKNNKSWFEKKGFKYTYDTCDLIKNVREKEESKLQLRNNNYIFRTACLKDKEELINFIHQNWPGRWEKEAIDYFQNGGEGEEYCIALDNNKICAFAKIGYPKTKIMEISYSLTWRNRFKSLGGIGPLGVDSQYRKRNLGYDIVAFANNVLIEKNVQEIIIDWTGLLDFYRKLGFEVFKSYAYMTKELNKERN